MHLYIRTNEEGTWCAHDVPDAHRATRSCAQWSSPAKTICRLLYVPVVTTLGAGEAEPDLQIRGIGHRMKHRRGGE